MTRHIHNHPDPANLVSYAAGTLHEALSAAVACHLAMCPDCARQLHLLEAVGGMLLRQASDAGRLTAPSVAYPGTPGTDDGAGRPVARTPASERLPAPLYKRYGLRLETVSWRWLGPGVMTYRLPLSRATDGDLRLLKIQPGRRMPEHGHGGSEMTVVIEGAYSDATGVYRRGDIQDADGDLEHQPVVLDGEVCVCLVASEQPARFKGMVSRLLQPVIGM